MVLNSKFLIALTAVWFLRMNGRNLSAIHVLAPIVEGAN